MGNAEQDSGEPELHYALVNLLGRCRLEVVELDRVRLPHPIPKFSTVVLMITVATYPCDVVQEQIAKVPKLPANGGDTLSCLPRGCNGTQGGLRILHELPEA